MLHHGAAVVGGALTFHFPLCASLIALDGYQSEVGSAIYNWACVGHPRGFVARVWYPLTMCASNITIAWIAVHVWMQPMALHFRLAFAILSFLIFALRTGGLIVFLTSADTPKDEATSEKTD
jgi:hypothetical protein